MKRKRALASIGLLAAVALVASACGGGKGTKTNTSNAAATSPSGGTPKTVPGFDGTTITLGVITPQTGPAAVIGNPLTAGNQVFWDSVNAKGGVAGKYKVKLTILDSKYDATTAVQDYAQMKGSVVMLQQLLGTPITKAVLPQLKSDNMLAAPASLDAEWVPEANLLPIGAPYQIQAINALSYYVNEAGGKGKAICSIVSDDPYGAAGKQGVDFAAKQLGFTLASAQTFKVGDKDFVAQVTALKKAKCDAVWITSLPTELGEILGTAAQTGFSPQWIGQSPTWVNVLAASALKTYLAARFWLASEGANWGDTTVPGMKQMLDDIAKYKPDQQPDIYFAFGYAQAEAVNQVLAKAVALGDLSHDGLQKAVSQVSMLNFGGLLGDYPYGGPDKRNPPRKTTLFKVVPGQPSPLVAIKANFESDAAKNYKFGS